MPPSRTDVVRSNAQAASKGDLALKTMTALLITFAAAMILVRAAGWAGPPLTDVDLITIIH